MGIATFNLDKYKEGRAAEAEFCRQMHDETCRLEQYCGLPEDKLIHIWE